MTLMACAAYPDESLHDPCVPIVVRGVSMFLRGGAPICVQFYLLCGFRLLIFTN